MATVITPRYSHITLLFLLVSSVLRAQDDKVVSQHLGRLRAIFDSAQVMLPQSGSDVSTDSSLISFVTKMEAPANPAQIQQDKLYLARRDLLRKQIGLTFTMDGVQNISPSQTDVEDNILYQRRIQNGVEWDVLKGGYLDSRNEMKALELEQELEQMIAARNPELASNNNKKTQLTYWFDLEKRKLLMERGKLLDRQQSVVTKLYYEKKITKDVLLELQSRIAEVDALEDIYSLYPDFIVPAYDSVAYSWDAPLFDLNYETILYSARREKESVDTAVSSLLARIEQQNKWFNEIRLKAYVRHSYYDLLTVNPGSRSFFSTGVGLSVPLTFTHKEQNAIEREKALIKLGQAEDQLEDRRIVMLEEAYEYRQRLKNYIVLNQRRIMVLEEIRKERVKEKLGDPDFSPMHGLELVDELLRIELELMDLKLDLYLRIVKVHELMETYPVQALIIPLQLPDSAHSDEAAVEEETPEETPVPTKVIVPTRAIFVPQTAFTKHPADFITEYILYNDFNEIQVQVPAENKWTEKQLACLHFLHQKGIRADLILKDPRLLKMDAATLRAELSKTINSLPQGVATSVHISVPIDNKQLKSLETLIAEAKNVCDSLGTKLSLDLPQSGDTALVNKMMAQVDKIWFPLVKPNEKPALSLSLKSYPTAKEKLGVALQSGQLGNRTEMEAVAKDLSKESGIRSTTFFDLEYLVSLDQKSVDPTPEKTDDYEIKIVTIPDVISERNVYVWSKIFLNFSVDQLSHYIQDNSFTGVQMAVTRRDELLDQKITFLKKLNDYRIQADLMYGRNSILDMPAAEMREELLQTLANYPLKYVHGLHLDVEPHAREDWDNNREFLQDSYRSLVKEARSICDSLGFKLTVDLPLTLDSAYVNEILTQTDLVRFMCYENTRKNYLVRKLRPYLDRKEKLVIALRTEDFKSRDEMEDFAKRLKKETGIRAINFHDLGRLMNLDLKGTPDKTSEVIEPEKPKAKEEEPEIAITKNVYVWSRTFGYYPVRKLAAFVDTNDFKEVQLAIVRGDVYLDDKRAFMIAMNQLGVKVDLMFAQKQILNVGSVKMRMEMTQTLAKYPLKYVQGIHLDIEPHTRRDWRRNPEGLKLAYSMLLDEARFICDSMGLKLSVDIPVNYDATFIKAAMRKSDVVRLLCYNTSRKNAIIRRLRPYLGDKEKLAIALQTEDFRSMKAMNELAKQLAKETGITTINFHDLRNLIELDH